MSAKEASVARFDSKLKAQEKSDSSQIKKFNNGKNINEYSPRSNAFSMTHISGNEEEKINSSNMKKTTKRNDTYKEDVSSTEKSTSPECCCVMDGHKTARKRKNETCSKTQRKRRKQKQTKVDAAASIEERNGYSDELKHKRKASIRQVVDVVEVEMDEKDDSNKKYDSVAGENMNKYLSDDEPLLIASDDLRFSPSYTSLIVNNSRSTVTTLNLDNGEEPANTQDGEVFVISSKPSGIPESQVIISNDLTEKALMVPSSLPEYKFQGSDVKEVVIKEDIELTENKVLEVTEMVPAEERVNDSEFGDLLLPEVFSESQLDEVVEVVSLVGCDTSWEVEASLTATKLLHVCWQGLDHHASSREIGGVTS